VVGKAEKTGLPEGCASVIYGEAMLTMQTPGNKAKIVEEALRLLPPGGRYGIHELCLVPDDLDEDTKERINQALSRVIHVGARPLTVSEWKALLGQSGFHVQAEATAPMHLLELPRMIQDEGLSRTLRIALNILRQPAARRRVLAMRQVFRQYEHHLAAVMLVAQKG
jgi:cyclopropane fatty-acyl-phospholipid synthase-like methyltransferase